MEELCCRRVNAGPWSLPASLGLMTLVSSGALVGEPVLGLGVYADEQLGVHGEDFESWRNTSKGELVADAVTHSDCRMRSMEALVCDGNDEEDCADAHGITGYYGAHSARGD